MNRGARKAPIFLIQADCQGFLERLGETVERFEWELHAYSLMPNHFHALVRSRTGNLSAGMQRMLGSYTRWLNKRHGWDGPVFRGRFRSQLVEREEHLRVLVAYIHLNPVTASLIRRVDDEGWTSYRAYMGKEPGPDWLTTSFFLGLLGGKERLHAFVESYRLGRSEYPEEFEPETGLFRRTADEGGQEEEEKKGECRRSLPVEEILERIQELTGADRPGLRRREMGSGANPARRFAIWALARRAGITHREIAGVLDVPFYQVGRVLGSLRKRGAREPVKGWMESWIAQER